MAVSRELFKLYCQFDPLNGEILIQDDLVFFFTLLRKLLALSAKIHNQLFHSFQT